MTQAQSQSSFVDVPAGHWAYDYIMAISNAQITTGCYQTPLMYCPGDNVTREQMAAFIVRAKEGEPPLDYCDSGTPFPDVTPDMWSCKYIKRLKELAITTGYQDGTYGPYGFVPREQMAAFLIRAVEGEPALTYCDSGSLFTDVTAPMWSCRYIKRLKERAITTGYGDGRYGPYDLVPREQMAAFLARAFLGMNPNAQLSGEYFVTYYAEKTTTLPPNIQTKTIRVDGNTADWAGINPLITDGAGNNWSGSPSGTDLTAVYLAKDTPYLRFRIDLGDGAPNTSARYRGYFSNQPNFITPYLYLEGWFNATQWQTTLYVWDGTTATLIGNGIAAVGASSIEMSIPITRFTDYGWTLDRWYIQGGIRSLYVNNTSYNYDLSDVLEARFQDIPNASWKEDNLATVTFDGQGGYTLLGSGASNAEGAEYPTSGSGTYTVNSDGTVTMSGLDGWKFGMQKEAKMLVGAAINDPDNFQGIALLFKKGGTHGLIDSQAYSVAYQKANNSQFCNLSSVDTDAQGNLTASGTQNSSSGLHTFNIAGTYTRNADGSGITTISSAWSAGTIGPAPGTAKYIPLIYPLAERDDGLFTAATQLNNQNRGRQRISANIDRPTAAQSNASLVGDFFLAVYHGENSDARSSLFGTITFDGAGNFTMSTTKSTSDQGGNQSGSESGTYSYDAATGTFLIGDLPETLVLNDEGDIALVTNIADTSYQDMGVLVKIK